MATPLKSQEVGAFRRTSDQVGCRCPPCVCYLSGRSTTPQMSVVKLDFRHPPALRRRVPTRSHTTPEPVAALLHDACVHASHPQPALEPSGGPIGMLRPPVDFASKCEFFIQPASPAVSCPPAFASVHCPHWPRHFPCFRKPPHVLLMPTAYAANLSHLPSHRLRGPSLILVSNVTCATHLPPASLHPPSSYPHWPRHAPCRRTPLHMLAMATAYAHPPSPASPPIAPSLHPWWPRHTHTHTLQPSTHLQTTLPPASHRTPTASPGRCRHPSWAGGQGARWAVPWAMPSARPRMRYPRAPAATR